MDKVDLACYRLRRQCWRCVTKSKKHYEPSKDDIKAARAVRERDRERISVRAGSR
jgi:hypothetical protein